ncbi:MAG: FAD-dependent oxidoreductase [Nocardioides sp.]|uniref:NAD(P)/FAD-dependent oxidoreductase n=1 Tax=Nocardioides sp. TaxID=35761 RepID=UPI0039E5243E
MLHPTLADAKTKVAWLDDPDRPTRTAPLVDDIEADLAVVGGGYTGLWTALLAAEAGRSVVLVEQEGCGDGASGRNGGFVSASLTHGFGNGLARWPDELDRLDELGAQNLREMGETIARLGIDCDFHLAGELSIAATRSDLEGLREEYEEMRARGRDVRWLEPSEIGARSESFLGGVLEPNAALVEPARLAWGLRQACLDAGVRLYESTPVHTLSDTGQRVVLSTPQGSVSADKVALGSNAWAPLVKGPGSRIVPVYDYVLMSEPLTDEQWEALGWHDGYGLADASPLFVYYRLTRDRRILWGGYDAVYHFGGRTGRDLEVEPTTHERLAQIFRARFPQVAELRWEYRWAGVIDTCSRFSAFFGTAHQGKVAYALGYTGLGVGATRFGAQVMLDLLSGAQTPRTRLEMVRTKPLPFPPEPIRWAGINLTRRAMAKEAATGRHGPWLRLLDKLGLGFDS